MLHMVTAVIKPHMLESVKDALRGAGVAGLTVTEVKGFGRQGGHTETYRGAEYQIDFVPKVKVEILCESSDAEKIAELIATSARTGKIGDGKIWIAPVDRAVRIRTGEMGADAV
ncbi:MAG: P-II family nitrogen regulator [Acidimicrobiia bacterium]